MPPQTPPGATSVSSAPALKTAYQTAKKKPSSPVDQGAIRMLKRKVAGK